MRCLAVLSLLLTLWTRSSLAIVQFLGSCLDDAWIRSMEASLKVDSQERDDNGRLRHPFLQPAARHFRRTLEDPRAVNPTAYSPDCMPADAILHGVGVKIDEATGVVLDKGHVNGSVVVDISPSVSGELAVGVFSILVAEVYGYPVSLLYVNEIASVTERMSSVGAGICTPTHANLELWSGLDAWLNIYANESAKVGLLGYIGVAGIYTTTDFVNDSNGLTNHPVPLSAEFWRNYATVDDLIDAVSYSKLKQRTSFFPPKDGGPYCPDDTFGCKDHCSKTHACTLRELRTRSVLSLS